MGRTWIAIVCGATLLIPAAGCSSSSGSPSNSAAADGGHTGSSPGTGTDTDGSPGGEGTDSSVPNYVAACTAAGGVCTMTATCEVTGPVNCGPGEICCMGTSTGSNMDAAAAATPDVCSSDCSDDAGTVAVADASRDAPAGD